MVPIQDSGRAQEELNAFLRSHKILSVDRRWVHLAGRAGRSNGGTGEATVSYCGDTTMKRWAWAGGLALAMGSLVAGCNESPPSTGSRGKEETDEKNYLAPG